jgi:hypothetical protein
MGDVEYDERPEFSFFDQSSSAASASPKGSAQLEWPLPGAKPDRPKKSCATKPVVNDELTERTPFSSQESVSPDEYDYVHALKEHVKSEWHDID